MASINPDNLLKRFLSYISIPSPSCEDSLSCPSTEGQLTLARKLLKEIRKMSNGLDITASIDKNGYLMARIPSNVTHDAPSIGFVAHYDTSPDFSGTGIKPQVIKNYDGKAIQLGHGLVLSPDEFESLKEYKGQTLVTTDGSTLLGADDKAGITEIMAAVEYLLEHPEVKHGDINICFTPDEEIGRGADQFDVKAFGADWAYTVDGEKVGSLEFENFNAAKCSITIKGKSIHPGDAKGKMINAALIVQEILNGLPKHETPQDTEGYEGFFHVDELQATVESAKLVINIRDHDQEKFVNKKFLVQDVIAQINRKYHKAAGTDICSIEVRDQYLNMREKIEPMFHIVEIAQKAMIDLGITPHTSPIRGGTDGSNLSYMGLPCPNIFAGGHNFHGPYEYVPLESMVKATQVIIRIAEITSTIKK